MQQNSPIFILSQIILLKSLSLLTNIQLFTWTLFSEMIGNKLKVRNNKIHSLNKYQHM